jgi:copper transport protein
VYRLVLALGLGLTLAVLAWTPLSPLGRATPIASAHALLVRSDPAADAVLAGPPQQIRMWFSEDLNPLTSRAVVVNTTNVEVDDKNSHVNAQDLREMDVGVQPLPAGTYVVDWRTQSAEDGHIVGGSFIFRIARPDGSVPLVPAQLPTGNVPGAGGTGVSPNALLDGPTILQAIATWLALLFMTFWVGGVIWQTWILSPRLTEDPDLAAAATSAAQRFRRLAPYALGLLLLADVGIVLGQSAELAGEWSGVVSLPLLRAILFGSRFGTFWWMRQLVAALALLLTVCAARYHLSAWRPTAPASPLPALDGAIPAWGRELLLTLRSVRALPGRIAGGWRGRSLVGYAECVLGGTLLVAFALSGHAAAVDASEFAYAIGVDLLHLLANAAWIGGLLYICVVFVPALRDLSARQRARVLALGLPQFGALALVSATMLAATGTLNTTIHLTSISQFLTTSYGLTLAVKIEFFVLMVGISAFHTFVLRPRLAYALAHESSQVHVSDVSSAAPPREVLTRVGGLSGTGGNGPALSAGAGAGGGHVARTSALPAPTQRLAERLEDWLRREAMIGVVILFCVALLAAFAGSLTPATASGATTSAATPATRSAHVVQTQHASNYAITLDVTPAAFGTNTFTVKVQDAQGKAVDGASVLLQTTMLDMDMGVQNVQLKAVGASAPGTYSGQSDLTMAGHWDLLIKVLPPNGTQFVQADFRLSASY